MKSFLRRILLVALFCVPWVMNAQTHYNIQIGSGTATSQYVPSYGYYNYSYTQSLYTAGEVGIDGAIDALSFQVAQNSLARTLTIYMAEVSQTTMGSAVPASEFHQVYSGSVNFAPGWVSITLDTAFDYQDTGSLVIAVIDGTGSYNSTRPSFYGTTKDATRARYVYNDNSPYTLSSSLSSSTSFLPNIIVGINSYSTYCAAPSDVTVSGIQNDEATISWVENGDATTWEVVVSDTAISNTELDNAPSVTVYDTSYTVNNLDGNTLYYVYVRAICDGSSSSAWTTAVSFRSACVGYTSIPYSTGFEGLSTAEMPNCWVQVASGSSSASTFPSAYAYGPNARNSSVYFEFESSTGQTEIAALPPMDNLSSLMLTFYASCMNTNFVLEAGVMENDNFVPLQTVQLTPGSGNNWAGSYYPYTVYYGSYTGSGERMALRVTASGSYTLMIDDLTVDYLPTCPEPGNLTLDSVGVDWAAISWVENGSATSWVVEYDTVDFVPGSGTGATVQTVSSNDMTISGLDSGMTYHVYVRSDCGGDASDYISMTFTTLAGAPATLPFSCDFEADGVNGWELVNGTQTNHWMVGNGANNGGSRSLYITNDDATNAYSNSSTSYVYAIRNINIGDAGEFVYSYDWRNQGESHYYDFIRVFLAPASAEFNAGSVLGGGCYSFSSYSIPSSWIDLSGITGSNKTLAQSSSWQNVTGTFTLATPGSYKLVFAWANDASGGSNPPAAIDNVQLIRNTCPAPINLTVTNVTTTDVTVEWQSLGDETAWEAYDGTNSYLANDTTYTLTNLTPDHNYTIRVRAICDVDDTSMAINVSTRTLQSCIRPLGIVVDSVLGDTVWVSWTDTTNATLFDLAFGPTGFDPDTAYVNVETGVSATSFMFTGLTMGQRYDFYVRVDCGNEQSSWVGPASAVPSYQYVMAASGSDTLHVCGYTIYDNGGETGSYSSNCSSTLVVFPNDITNTVVLSGTLNTESCCDHLYIYDGVGTSGTLLYQGEGTTSFSNITSEEGVVTIHFTSDGSIQNDGFEISVACVPLPDCPHPSQLTVSNIGTQSADVAWVELGSATSWILQYDTVNFIPGGNNTANSMIVNTNPYSLTGLDSGMVYYVYVASYCNPDTSTFIGTNFPTLAASPALLPYSCDFEQAGVNGWDLINGSQTNHWTVGSGASNGGSQGLYITDGTANNYDINSTSTVFASRTIYLDSVGEYAFSFDWKAEGEGTYDYLRVALVPVTVDLTAGSQGSWGTSSLPSGAIALDGGSKLNLNGSWVNRTGTVNVTTAGAYNLVFFWHNDNIIGTQPPAAIDNVMITRMSCPSPANLTVTRLTSDSVYLSWNGNGANGPWLVSYDNVTITEYGTTVGIGGLTAGTQYTFSVATLCGTDTSFYISLQAVPGTWTMRPNQTDTLYMCGGVIYDDGGATGAYSGNQNSIVILRPDAPNSLVSVSGTSYTESTYDYLRIYDGIGTGGTQLWNDYGVSSNQTFGPIESTSGPLTIEFISDGSVFYDGFAINVSCITTSCRVMNLQLNPAAGEYGTQLSLVWDPVTDAQQYEIEYGVSGFAQGQGQMMTSTTNSVVITGLTALTNYDVYVRSLCSGNDTGSWAHGTYATAMCDNAVEVYNYDSTQSATTSSYSPVGYSLYNYSYVQTIIPAGRIGDLAGEVTAMAFNTASTTAGTHFTNMTVWMANVSEDSFPGDFIQADATHLFTKVIDSADFCYNTTGWQIHSLDSSFIWDGVSNILVSVHREHGSWTSGSSFQAHQDTAARTCYTYRDTYPYDPSDVNGGGTSTYVGDIKLISCGAGCTRPGGLHATDVTYSTANLHWSGSATNYEVSIKAATDGAWPMEVAVNGASSYNATGLSAATRYQFRVRSVCDAAENMISDWVVGNFVTDSLPCFVPEELHTVETGYTTATLAWTADASQSQWSVRVWNTAGGNDYVADGTPYTVTGLAQNTTYYAAVKSICGGGAAESEYGDTVQFTTGQCPKVEGVTVSSITSNSAVVSWTSNGASKYKVEYGDRNFNQGQGTTVMIEDGSTTVTLNSLRINHNYSVFVMAICEEGADGAWSDRVDFATLDGDAVDVVYGSMNLSIYPNPTSDATTIALSGVSGEVTITIVDMNGRTVQSETMTCEGDCTKRMEVSGLAQGAYFVRVSGEGVNQVKKLVVK